MRVDLILVSLMSHPVSQRETWHPVISHSMRVDPILVSLMSHPVSQRETWHPVISDSMRVDPILVSLMSLPVSQRKTWHPSYITQCEGRSDIGISDESPCLSEEDLAPSYIRHAKSPSERQGDSSEIPISDLPSHSLI